MKMMKFLKKVREREGNNDELCRMSQACLKAIVELLNRQYRKYYEADIPDQLEEESKSAMLP